MNYTTKLILYESIIETERNIGIWNFYIVGNSVSRKRLLIEQHNEFGNNKYILSKYENNLHACLKCINQPNCYELRE